MQNGKIPNSALSASSKLNANYGPENARLHFHPVGGRQGAWIPSVQNHNQWFQVDFGVETQVTRIATQGRQNANQYVTKYTLRYSLDKSYWNQYQPFGYTLVSKKSLNLPWSILLSYSLLSLFLVFLFFFKDIFGKQWPVHSRKPRFTQTYSHALFEDCSRGMVQLHRPEGWILRMQDKWD